MAPRAGSRRERDYDFANVGIIGRRTGVTVEHRPLDDHGFEQVSSFFSSPTKPSPPKRVASQTISQADSRITPKASMPSRKSARGASAPPRSASPRKSGISGTAKRGNVIDKLVISNADRLQQENEQAKENQPPETPEHSKIIQSGKRGAMTMPRRFSPEKTPLRSQAPFKPRTSQVERQSASAFNVNGPSDPQEPVSRDKEGEATNAHLSELENGPYNVADSGIDEPFNPLMDETVDDIDGSQVASHDNEEGEYQIFNKEGQTKAQRREPTQANSRKKRKSDNLEDQQEPDTVSSPAAKRAKRRSEEGLDHSSHREPVPVPVKAKAPTKAATKAKASFAQKNSNLQLSVEQEQELGNIVERVKARPSQQKSLYILRKETPDNGVVTHTRSGRISVKPLAYWRNERCVYGGSPGGASIADGARFPLNSIREIIRTENIDKQYSKQKKKSSKSRRAGPGPRATSEAAAGHASENEADDLVDSDAEPWETDVGTLRGQISVWDPEQQAPVEQEEEIDIAYASAAIETKEVKGSSFRYAKLLSNKFFSTGIVDLPPGAVKRPKNSRKMHMSFFVAKGRVTVEVGPINGPECRFSIGKGGFWQVPRGNQYSIHNRHERPARIFFSQACEPAPQDLED